MRTTLLLGLISATLTVYSFAQPTTAPATQPAALRFDHIKDVYKTDEPILISVLTWNANPRPIYAIYPGSELTISLTLDGNKLPPTRRGEARAKMEAPTSGSHLSWPIEAGTSKEFKVLLQSWGDLSTPGDYQVTATQWIVQSGDDGGKRVLLEAHARFKID